MATKTLRWVGITAALGLAALSLADAKVNGVTTRKSGEGVEVIVAGEGLTQPRIIKINDSSSYILEWNATLEGKAGRSLIYDNGLALVKWGWYSAHPAKVRVLLRLMDGQDPELKQSGDTWVVGVHTGATTVAAKTPTTTPAETIVKATSKPVATTTTVVPAKNNNVIKPLETKAAKPSDNIITTTIKLSTEPELPVAMPVLAPKDPHSPDALVATVIEASKLAPKVEPAVTKSTATKTAAKTTAKSTSMGAAAKTDYSKFRVSLDFSNTDIVQILRALALQANVNIVASPEVKGPLTVSLEHVTVKDALDLITAMSGVKYAQLGSTFVVTSPARFSGLMHQMGAVTDDSSESRVIPLYSGMGSQIKAAVYKSFPIEMENGRYDVILPSDDTTVSKFENLAPAENAPQADSGKDGGAPKIDKAAVMESKSTGKGAKDTYALLVGSKGRLDEVEKEIRRLDVDIAHSLGVQVSEETGDLDQAMYKANNNAASTLLKAICEPDRTKDLETQPNQTTVGKVHLYASNAPGNAEGIVVLNGPKNEVASIMGILTQLDVPGLGQSAAMVYEVKFVDPKALAEHLSASFPGLVVTVPPQPVNNPLLYKKGTERTDVNQQLKGNSGQNADNSSSTNVNGSTSGATSTSTTGSSGGGSTGDALSGNGLNLPYTDKELLAYPMRLVLRGSPSTIQRAVQYLELIDTAPRQVAIEMRVMELTKDDALNAGLKWDLLTGGAVKFIKLDNSQTTFQNSAGGHFNTNGVSGDILGQLDKISNNSNLIARPNVIASDGRQTELFVGDAIRYVESIISSQNGLSVTTGTVRVGVRMAVLARIGAEGNVTMDLRPAVSFLRGFTQVPQIGGQLPQTSERTAQETVTMMSGETIAIGGLIQDQDRKNWSGLPILGDLPIIGQLFRRTNNERVRTELVIFLTAREIHGALGSESPKLPMRDGVKKNDWTNNKGGN